MKKSPLLQDLEAQLRELDETIKNYFATREDIRMQITRERARLRLERARTAQALEENVIARLDADMRASEIAAALGCSKRQVDQIVYAWRKKHGTTVRRGRTIPERRSVRAKKAQANEDHDSR